MPVIAPRCSTEQEFLRLDDFVPDCFSFPAQVISFDKWFSCIESSRPPGSLRCNWCADTYTFDGRLRYNDVDSNKSKKIFAEKKNLMCQHPSLHVSPLLLSIHHPPYTAITWFVEKDILTMFTPRHPNGGSMYPVSPSHHLLRSQICNSRTQNPVTQDTHQHGTSLNHILLICVSFVNASKLSRLFHHSNSIVLQISLNQGVNFRAGSLNISLSSWGETYFVACASLGLIFKVTLVLMKRM